VPACFWGEMRNLRNALTPSLGATQTVYGRPALFSSRLPCSKASGQPYMLTILLEERSMSNSYRLHP
jgi:hypothetical protein